MVSDKLYELAFEYQKRKMWRRMWDDEIFAVKFSDGKIGYCNVMGAAGEHFALGVYIGVEGFSSYRLVATLGSRECTELQYEELLLCQDCLQCAFESQDILSDEEAQAVKQYANQHGIRLRGGNSYPQFVRYRPNRFPWEIQDEREQEYLREALSAAIDLACHLDSGGAERLGLVHVDENTDLVPLVEYKDGAYCWSHTSLPRPTEPVYPAPCMTNDIAIKKLKEARKTGIWECELVRVPKPMQLEENEAPYFPILVLTVAQSNSYLLPVEPLARYEDEPEKMLAQFTEAFLMENIRPTALRVRDERTFAFAKDFCAVAGIHLSICDDLPFLDEVEDEFLQRFGMDSDFDEMDDILTIFTEILQCSDEDLRKMPKAIIQQFWKLAEHGILPDDIVQKLKQLDVAEDSGADPQNAEDKQSSKVIQMPHKAAQSYVISVSVGKGCYRHIRISDDNTLFELHQAILDAFSFNDDHPHAFFMDNHCWSGQHSYVSDNAGSITGPSTSAFTLAQTGLTVGQQFKYLFGFGDEWLFQCKVLRTVDEKTDKPVVIRRTGAAPDQYET